MEVKVNSQPFSLFEQAHLWLTPVYHLLSGMAKHYPQRKVLISPEENALTYAELLEKSLRLANGLKKLGVKKGDRVVIALPNSFQFVISFFALMRLGAVAVPVDYLERSFRIKNIIEQSKAKVIISQAEILQAVGFKSIIAINCSSPSTGLRRDYLQFPVVIAENRPIEEETVIDIESPALIVYQVRNKELTGIVLNHRNLTSAVYQISYWFRNRFPGIFSDSEEEERVSMAFAPFYHPNGLISQILFSISSGFSLWVSYQPYPDNLLMLFRGNHYLLWATPVFYNQLLKDFKTPRLPFIRIAVSLEEGFDHLLEENLYQRLRSEKEISQPVLRFIGFPEVFPLFIKLLGESAELAKELEIKIDHNDELLVSGPQVFSKYWYNYSATRRVKKDDYWRTGLVVEPKDEKSFFILEQLNNEVIYTTSIVCSEEIEMALEAHPAVKKAVVVGKRINREEIEAEIIAFVVLRREARVTEKVLKDYCRRVLRASKIPLRIEIINLYSKGGLKNIIKIFKRGLK